MAHAEQRSVTGRTEEERVMTGREMTVDGALRQQVLESMTALLVRMLRLALPVTEETRLMDELGLSSSQAMELLVELEGELSIAIDVEELDQENMYTVGELADYIAGHSAAV
jgi:acyl carrier protein